MAVIASDARIAGMQQNYPPRSAVISWIFFDWAAQPYFTLITTFVFAPYFATYVASDPASGQALWGFATAAAGLGIALMSPALGPGVGGVGPRGGWWGERAVGPGGGADRGARRPPKAVDRGVRRVAGD